MGLGTFCRPIWNISGLFWRNTILLTFSYPRWITMWRLTSGSSEPIRPSCPFPSSDPSRNPERPGRKMRPPERKLTIHSAVPAPLLAPPNSDNKVGGGLVRLRGGQAHLLPWDRRVIAEVLRRGYFYAHCENDITFVVPGCR